MSEIRFEGGGGGGFLFPYLEKSSSLISRADQSHVAQQSRRDKLRVPQTSNLQELLHHSASSRPDVMSDVLSFLHQGTHFPCGRHPAAAAGESSNYWGGNYLSGSGGSSNVSNIINNVSPLVVGGGDVVNKENSSTSHCSLRRPGHGGYQDNVQSPPTHLSNQTAPEMGYCNFIASPSFNYQQQSSLQDVVFLPSFAAGDVNTCTSPDNNNYYNNASSQRLSLSLSSHHPSDQTNPTHLVGGATGGVTGGVTGGATGGVRVFHSFAHSRSTTTTNNNNNTHDVGGSCSFYCRPVSGGGGSTVTSDLRRSAGPLGPFTGYATILKSSRFLKPARQLLDELCCFSASSSDLVKATSENIVTAERAGSAEPSSSGDVFNVDNEGMSATTGLSGNSGGSASAAPFYSSGGARGTCTGGGNGGGGFYQGIRPEFQRRKAKLLSMQEEVGRRYKQYHQQMQMVISSFESVAGLTAATPFISFALKSVTKHFRSLKQAISEQIRTVSKVLGEELISTAATSDDIPMQKLRFFDHSFRKHKAGDNLAFLEHQQPVWRPQRGLPERAVAVLRAWLFEHFLHPYPTDTDKHMLAAQTGLSRNQVSNWFINARVRVWKPMVEEIHMLETKGSADQVDLNSIKNDSQGGAGGGAAAKNAGGRPSMNLPNESVNTEISQKQSNTYSNAASILNGSQSKCEFDQWHPEKRSKMEECQIPRANLDGGMMDFMPYHSGMEIIGPGAVSLTLGLQHTAENMQHKQQLQQQQHQLQQLQQHQREQQLSQLGGHHLLHDFTA
ncbi:hypothetical protein H6P81_017727 [Aristolochia fimbriata]|uniref:Homeobox domain-containing protein n=1 Tax=Aristolochia fimbriata TaxID=158543 RepID=A0AAV7E3A1_ARIFI|nr:hypothetical protein H6P81_017727 [Aristolochia fimbriata]